MGTAMANFGGNRYFWTYRDLAKLSGLSENAVQQHKSRGALDPGSLRSVALFLAANGTEQLRQEINGALLGGRRAPKTRRKGSEKKARRASAGR